MTWLNYHHLHYFWTVAREGTLTAASQTLRLAPSTLSDQIRKLEDTLEVRLFSREGRRLQLTDTGQLALQYAEEIFRLGRELTQVLQQGVAGAERLRVGISDVVPKLVAWRLLSQALAQTEPMRLICTEGRPERLLGDLALHQLDVVITDSPLGGEASVRAFNHLLGETGVRLFGTRELARRWGADLPGSLDGAPLLLPTPESALRRGIDHWFEVQGVRPQVVGEFEDSALMTVFGQHGHGLFPGPVAVSTELERQHRVVPVLELASLKERFYAITVERRIRHPALVALSAAARDSLFCAET